MATASFDVAWLFESNSLVAVLRTLERGRNDRSMEACQVATAVHKGDGDLDLGQSLRLLHATLQSVARSCCHADTALFLVPLQHRWKSSEPFVSFSGTRSPSLLSRHPPWCHQSILLLSPKLHSPFCSFQHSSSAFKHFLLKEAFFELTSSF